ncbi:hypothetical protein Acr_00g0033200 [Actinidia rufa]|uniref:SWIM-type domain-containing protein n=1 Tax=Actinidia rufa TaxID=165716 RepID=A0A7J0DFS8_9ERIC|nr:hypothetical protein Acr_00g0033200 [Actinidia rufa]
MAGDEQRLLRWFWRLGFILRKVAQVHENVGVRNPGTAVILETLDLGIMGVRALDRIFWAFRPCIEGFKHCPPVIGIDGTNSESAARAYRALCNEDPMKWTLAYDGGYRWGVTTTNDSECYNNVLRGARDLPITSCVEVTLYRLVATFNDKRRQIESALAKGLRYTSKVQAKLEEYQARSAGHHGIWFCRGCYKCSRHNKEPQHAVYVNPPSCDCGKWMIYHYPCSHMLAVCAKSGRQPWHLIDPKYRMDVYAHVKRQHNHCGICKAQGHDRRLMDTVGSPGPIDDTVLTLQSHHRSTWIWEHGGTDALACRRYGTGLYDRELDPQCFAVRIACWFLRCTSTWSDSFGPRIDHGIRRALETGDTYISSTYRGGQHHDICMHAFGVIPPAEDIDRGRLRMSWLRRTFDVLPEHADDVSVQRHARAYILRLIGGILFTDYSQTLVRVAYLPFLLDLDAAGACSWGVSAVLAMLYRSMCRATKIGQRQIVGALLLLQIWACERFPLSPVDQWGARWRSRFRTTTTSTHVVRVYRDQLDRLRLTSSHGGRTMISCMSFLIIVGLRVIYGRITRTLVGNPAHRPTSGYVEIGSTIEIATRYIAAIYMIVLIGPSMRHFMHYVSTERIGQPGVPEPPPTIPPVVPAASPAMPPAFPVHPPPSMSSSQQFTQYVGATQIYASYVTPTMPSYTYHISAHDVPSSSRPSSSGIRPRRTTHRHITSPVTYDRCSSFSPVGDDDEFDLYVDPLLASRGQMEIPVSVEGVSQITQVELQRRPEPEPEPQPEPQPQPQPEPQPQPQPHRLGTLTHVFSRRPRPSRDRRPPRCGTGGHM